MDDPSKSDFTDPSQVPDTQRVDPDKEEGPEEDATDKKEEAAPFPEKKKTCCAGCSCSKCTPPGGMSEYFFNIWDGMQMIRYDIYELPRFQGSEPRCFDKCKSFKWLFCTLIIGILGFSILSTELGSIGNLKN